MGGEQGFRGGQLKAGPDLGVRAKVGNRPGYGRGSRGDRRWLLLGAGAGEKTGPTSGPRWSAAKRAARAERGERWQVGLRVRALTRSWAWRASRAELRRCALGRTEGGKREWAARLGCPGWAEREGTGWNGVWARAGLGKEVWAGFGSFFFSISFFPILKQSNTFEFK